ncbi:cysteine synthase A [Antricoccus suffuscus]|uniref:O-acetylserine sulfhydrylase n=1 Tax=Antricoccus suffuscus TaxID=1629062 RepID=A0A2T0ZXN2_9ACTN|nr:cysteine synthase A [Antricoccus suffuscus]PRZ41093.1 cysteine synthase A [Antricoccus suffuscus]
MPVYESLTEVVGRTPLLALNRLAPENPARLLAKLEFYNPLSSIKDRTGLSIVRAAEADGRLKPGGTIVEATSGNTGIALAWIGAALGYRVVLVLPDDMSNERLLLLRALGAEVEFTPGADGMAGANQRAGEIIEADPTAFLSGQGGNPANPAIHEATTGPEIWADTDGKVDVIVAATGTGGSLSGTGRFLRTKNPDVKVIGVEPDEAPVLNGGEWQPHKIQGITGGNGVPPTTDMELIDEVVRIPEDTAIEVAREAMRVEGLMVGISSGAVLEAMRRLGQRPELKSKTIVGILADTGERYLSTELFDHVRS